MTSSLSSLTGAAGEHFVLSQLLRRGWIAALAPEGVPNTDIIITDIEGNRQFAVQVKTRSRGSDKGWHMSKKHEQIISNTLIYCFVDMEQEPNQLPVTYVIPSGVVADVIKTAHQYWLDTPGRGGRMHRDNKMRRLLPDYIRNQDASPELQKKLGKGWLDPYRENWGLLDVSIGERL